MGLEMKYFVLKPRGDGPYAVASRMAMRTYATHIRAEDADLANALLLWEEREGYKAHLDNEAPPSGG